jgi:hypothetical protein
MLCCPTYPSSLQREIRQLQRAAAAAAAPAEEAEEPASGRRSRRAKREAGAVGGMGRRSELPDDLLPKVAIVGRPNVGKSGAQLCVCVQCRACVLCQHVEWCWAGNVSARHAALAHALQRVAAAALHLAVRAPIAQHPSAPRAECCVCAPYHTPCRSAVQPHRGPAGGNRV